MLAPRHCCQQHAVADTRLSVPKMAPTSRAVHIPLLETWHVLSNSCTFNRSQASERVCVLLPNANAVAAAAVTPAATPSPAKEVTERCIVDDNCVLNLFRPIASTDAAALSRTTAIMPQRLRFAVVCASNQNRSMEAHRLLKEANLNVSSYGVGGHVKLPGPSAREPNVYDFGTRYEDIFNDLKSKDEALYTRNGLLQMLRRNMAIKSAPEKWQHNRDVFDVVVCFEERVMQQVVDDLASRPQIRMRPVLVINIDVKDNHEEAARVAPQTVQLCKMLEAAESWEAAVDAVMLQFETQHQRRATYNVCYI